MDDLSLQNRLKTAIKIMIRQKGGFHNAIESAMLVIVHLEPRDFPLNLQHDWEFIKSAAQKAEKTGDYINYKTLHHTFRDEWCEKLIEIYSIINKT